MTQKLYVTTMIPYVNADPHVGFALELVQADALARLHRRLGHEVRLQTGTDENALKNVLAARRQGLEPRDLVDRTSQRFRDLVAALDISADAFIRTTSPAHARGVHALWNRLSAGDVYRKEYRGLYCTGCEDFYLEKELAAGRCPEHGTAPVAVSEVNYFFRLSSYQERIERCLEERAVRIVPETRRNEVLAFVRRRLQDISISRAADRSGGWGIRVPGDDSQVIYVWIDALVNYLSGSGFGSDETWRQWWNAEVRKVHLIGKNVWKFHAIYWPALLLSAGLPLPDEIAVHGFLTVNGRKIGKSLGNAVDPFACIEAFGNDAVRWYLLRAITPFGDSDFSLDRLRQLYNTDLAGGLGNLVSRLATLAERAGYGPYGHEGTPEPLEGLVGALDAYAFDTAAGILRNAATAIDRDIETCRPWIYLKEGRSDIVCERLDLWLSDLYRIAYWLEPLLPRAAGRMLATLSQPDVRHAAPLFPRMPE